jgi:hypothetical protein
MNVAFGAGFVEGLETLLDQLGVVVARRCVSFPLIVSFENVEFFRGSLPLRVRLGLGLLASDATGEATATHILHAQTQMMFPFFQLLNLLALVFRQTILAP